MVIITEILELNVDSTETSHRVIPMPRDGSCLFHSIAYSLYNSIDNQQTSLIRTEIVDYVCENWEDLNAWTVDKDGEPFENSDIYRSEMLKYDTFGSVCELKAAGSLYPLCIEVYRDGILQGVFGEKDRPVKRFLFSGFHNYGHYDVCLPLEPEFFGTEIKLQMQFKRIRQIREYYLKKRLVKKLKAIPHKMSLWRKRIVKKLKVVARKMTLCLSKRCNLIFRKISRRQIKRYRLYNTNPRYKKKSCDPLYSTTSGRFFTFVN